MVARFHINSKGEPGKCKAFAGNCPFGSDDEHYSSKKAAVQAFEESMGNSFELNKFDDVKIKKRDLLDVATNSSDPSELMAVASSINSPSRHRKTAAALASNPNTPAEVLVEARSRTDLAWNEFVNLELHPNYPKDKMTAPGGLRFTELMDKEELRKTLENESIGFNLIDQSGHIDSNYINFGLKNKNAKLSDQEIDYLATKSSQTLEAAVSTGKYPNEIAFENNRVLPNGDSRTQLGDKDFAIIARHTADQEVMKRVFERYKKEGKPELIARAILDNPHLTSETKSEIKASLKSYVDRINNLIG